MPELRRVDHLRPGDTAVHPSGKVLFEVLSVAGWSEPAGGTRAYRITVRMADGTLEERSWAEPDSVWVTVA